jgi:hypothetical protein
MADRELATETVNRSEKFEWPRESTSQNLLPSLQDMQSFQNRSNGPVDRCEGDFTKNPNTGFLEPTDKREAYNEQARDALNAPQLPTEAPNEKEREIATDAAKQLQEFSNRNFLDDMDGYDKQWDGLKKMFSGLGPDETKRVLGEINQQLDGTNLKIAQAESGEIWLGKRNEAGGKYYQSTIMKEAPGCLTS